MYRYTNIFMRVSPLGIFLLLLFLNNIVFISYLVYLSSMRTRILSRFMNYFRKMLFFMPYSVNGMSSYLFYIESLYIESLYIEALYIEALYIEALYIEALYIEASLY